MDGTILGVGVEDFITGLSVICLALLISNVAFFYSWRREVNKRKRQSKGLLENIKFSFSNEIVMAISGTMKAMESVLTDFRKGEYSVILENSTFKPSKEFSESVDLLCDNLNKLRREIEEGVNMKNISTEDAVAVASFISSISTSVVSMKALVDSHEAKSFYDAVDQCSRGDKIIKGLRDNMEKLKQYVSELNKSKEE